MPFTGYRYGASSLRSIAGRTGPRGADGAPGPAGAGADVSAAEIEAARLATAEDAATAEAAATAAVAVGTTNDTVIAGRINDPASITAEAVTAAKVAHVNGFRDAVEKLRNQQQAVNLLFVTDSTGDVTTGGTKWTTGFAAAVGALFPTHTVIEHTYNYSATNNWNTATTIQTGTGFRTTTAPELHVWLAGWAGKNWSDWLQDTRRDKVFGAADFDTITFGMGHNDGYLVLGTEPTKSRDLAFIEWVRTLRPRAQIVLCSQNPRAGVTGQPSPGHAEVRNDIYRSLAREHGYGYINITQAFHDDGRTLTPGAGGLIDDGVHPTTAGYALWRETVLRQFRRADGAVPLPSLPPALTMVTKRVDGMHVRPITAAGWTASNVTETTDSTIKYGNSPTSIKLTKTAGGAAAFVQKDIAVAAVRGRDATAFGRIHVPSTPADIKASFGWFIDGVLQYATPVDPVLVDQFMLINLSVPVPATATQVRGRLWVDNDTSADTPSIYVDSLDIIVGNTPMSVADSASAVTGSAPIDTWAASTVYASGRLVVFGGATYQAVSAHTSSASFRADLAAGNWVHINGHGRVESVDPAIMPGFIAYPAASRAYYYRVTSAAAISALAVEVNTATGNILAAVYSNNGQTGRAAAPSTLTASSGSVAAVNGKQSLSLGGTVGVAAGDWVMIAADNTTVRLRAIAAANGVGNTQGRVGFEALSTFAASSPPGSIAWTGSYAPWVGGE